MKKKEIKKNSYLYFEDDSAESFYQKIENKEYRALKVLKDDKRSHVLLIQIDEKKYVLKEPKEKNSRLWQRILSFFRGGESSREFQNCEKILEMGFKGAKPIFAWERKSWGAVIDSYSVAEFVEGEATTVKEIEPVLNLLKEIHRKGYLHGDSHLGNFMNSSKEIYLIDCKLQKNRKGRFGKAYEIKYLENSCHDGRKLYEGSDIYYWTAVKIDEYLHWWRRFKKKIRGR